jgi:hypothetical protein
MKVGVRLGVRLTLEDIAMWGYSDPRKKYFYNVRSNVQAAIEPAQACLVYTTMGQAADPALTLHPCVTHARIQKWTCVRVYFTLLSTAIRA